MIVRMRRRRLLTSGSAQGYAGWEGLAVLMLLVLAGCRNAGSDQPAPVAHDPQPTDSALSSDADSDVAPLLSAAAPRVRPTADSRLDIFLRVLHVQVPRAGRAQTERLWQQLREDALDSATLRRLNANGVRVGVGRTERWDAVRAPLDQVKGNRVCSLRPLRTPPGMPLALELDREPDEHTIFYLNEDRIATGDTWPASQRVLRLTYTLDTQEVGRIYLTVVPEIRRSSGPGWSRTEDGWIPGSMREGRAFAAAAFAVTLRPNEFVVIAPGPKADVFGLVGGAFLKTAIDDQPYDSYVFVRAEVTDVNEHR